MGILAGLETTTATPAGATIDAASAPPLGADTRRALRERIRLARETLRDLPEAEQQRLYQESRAKNSTLFALLHRLQDDPDTRSLVRAAVERTRLAPSDAELARAGARAFSAAFRAGIPAFRPSARYVLGRLCEEFGYDNARRLKLSDLQRGYLATAARSKGGGFETAAVVLAVVSVGELWEFGSGASGGPADPPVVAEASSAASIAVPVPASASVVGEHLLATSLVAACLNIEAGMRNFSEFAEAMAADLGEAVRPYLRVFYEAIRHYPGIDLSGRKAAAPPVDGFLLAA
jgi:hypothetical protein